MKGHKKTSMSAAAKKAWAKRKARYGKSGMTKPATPKHKRKKTPSRSITDEEVRGRAKAGWPNIAYGPPSKQEYDEIAKRQKQLGIKNKPFSQVAK